MAADDNNNNANVASGKGKKRRRYLPNSKPARKGLYPLRPGVQGFFITCDGGRERQASNEALGLLDNFYDELLHWKKDDSGALDRRTTIPTKPINTIIQFHDSDSDNSDNSEDEEDNKTQEEEKPTPKKQCVESESEPTPPKEDDEEKKQCVVESEAPKGQPTDSDKTKVVVKSIDDRIEEELKELGDRKKRHFVSLDSGCNGCIFIQMHRSAGDPGPASIVQHMMNSAASTRKHMSRFILRVVPAEVTCYSSEEEISRAIKPLVEQYFPAETSTPKKFAVLYEARANTGVDRMTIINAVAKSIPQVHKVDLKNPDKTIVVQIAKTICMVGVVEKYKELSKYNLRQLTTPLQ